MNNTFEHPWILISSSNRISFSRHSPMRPNLSYYGIARRAIHSSLDYDRELDVSAVLIYTIK